MLDCCILLLVVLAITCSANTEPTLANSPRMVVGAIELEGLVLTTEDTSLFNIEVGSLLRNAFAVLPVLNTTFKYTQSSVVSFFLWFGGSPVAQGELSAAALRTNVSGLWPTTGNMVLASQITSAAQNMFGSAPSDIVFSDQCVYALDSAPSGWSTPSPSSTSFVECTSKTPILVTMSSNVDASTVKSAICDVLSIDCSMLTVETAVLASDGYRITVTLTSYYPLQYLSILCDRASTPSQLSFLGITSMSVNGVAVYVKGSIVQSEFDGSFQDCVSRLWYLIFLILLVPLSYVITSKCYSRGKQRGRLVAKESEDEAKEKAIQILQNQAQVPWQQALYLQRTQGHGQQYYPQQFPSGFSGQ